MFCFGVGKENRNTLVESIKYPTLGGKALTVAGYEMLLILLQEAFLREGAGKFCNGHIYWNLPMLEDAGKRRDRVGAT